MKRLLTWALLLGVGWLATADVVVQTRATSAAAAAAVAAALQTSSSSADENDERTAATDGDHREVVVNDTSPCDRYLRSAGVEVRNPRNHKFITSNGWTERLQRPQPEINVYSHVEEFPPSSPPPPLPPKPMVTETGAFHQQRQRDSFYQQHRQPSPVVRTAKRIIYYATLPDVIRQPPPPPSGYAIDPYTAIGPGGGPYSIDFRQYYDSNRNAPSDLQRNRLIQSFENAYNHDSGGGNGGRDSSVTSITSSKLSSAALYDSRYNEPAEFRGDQFYRPPTEFASKFTSWTDPSYYKGWTPSYSNIDGNLHNRIVGPSSFSSWDREPNNNRLGGGSWENRGSSWDKELVEVPLKRPSGGGGEFDNDDKYRPEVAVVQSGVIDVRGDRLPNGSPPPPRFTIVDYDPKPYHHQRPLSMWHDEDDRGHVQQRYEPPQKPVRYEAYTPVEPPVRYEQQYRQPPPPPSSTRYGQQYNYKHSPYYENIKNNINTHQFTTSWTEVSTQDNISPTHTVSLDISSTGNSTSLQNKTAAVATLNTNATKTAPN